MTQAAFDHMSSLAHYLAEGLRAIVARHGLHWTVSQMGARAELVFSENPLRNGAEAAASIDHIVERALHLFLLNRQVLVTPFHNMTLVAPTTTKAQVDMLVAALGEAIELLCGKGEM